MEYWNCGIMGEKSLQGRPITSKNSLPSLLAYSNTVTPAEPVPESGSRGAGVQRSTKTLDSRLRGCVTMSLRGSETTEAISEVVEIQEIAALPSVARNDRKGL